MASLMRANVVYSDKKLRQELRSFDSKLNDTVRAVFDLNSHWGTAWMKINAPWTDDTGAARSGLTATANSAGSIHELLLAYSVNYGIWLEVANSGKFQVLGPAMRYIGDKILSDLQYLLDGKPPGGGGQPTQVLAKVGRKVKPNYNKSGNRRSRKAYGKRKNGGNS